LRPYPKSAQAHRAPSPAARIRAIEPTADLTSSLTDRQQRVDGYLRQLLAEKAGEWPPALSDAVGYSLLAPGKRLRPILVLLACRAAGGNEALALPAAAAVEMIHTYSLIHDDLPAMDDDDLRRGLPTCHKKFGDALAILAGDALLTWAFEVLAERCPAAVAAVSCGELARGAGAAGMVAGQVLDLAAEGKIASAAPPRTLADLEAIHRRKTGALFQASLRLGVYAALGDRVDESVLAAVGAYGQAFGLMFQVHDDLLDVEGCSEIAGKRVGKDAARGKLTYPGLLGVEESRRRADLLCRDAVQAVAGLGSAAEPLSALAMWVMDRKK